MKEFLITEGFPKDVGLVQSNVLVRKHKEKTCINLMEQWWEFIKTKSKRDQVSFNYLIWKNHLTYSYIKWNDINNKYILLGYKHVKTVKS